MPHKLPFKIFSGEKSEYLAQKICESLDCELGKKVKTTFSDGEFAVYYDETVRGCYVFIVQSTFPNSDNLMELLLMIDAAKRASAYKIIAVMPYFGWARQDCKDKPSHSHQGVGNKASLIPALGSLLVHDLALRVERGRGAQTHPIAKYSHCIGTRT